MTLETLKPYRPAILDLASKHGAHNLRVFGSTLGNASSQRDFDILVTLEPGRSLFDLGGLQIDLQDLLGMPVDVVTEGSLHPFIREQVLAEAVPL